MVHSKLISNPIFPIYINVIVSDSLKSCIKKYPQLKPYFDEDKDDFLAYTCQKDVIKIKNKHWYCIHVLFNPTDKELNVGKIAHEAVHVAHEIFQHIGYVVDPTNDEMMAYVVSWLVDSFSSVINNSPFNRSLPSLNTDAE